VCWVTSLPLLNGKRCLCLRRLNSPREEIQKILKITQKPISLETPTGEEEGSSLEDFVEDKEVISPQNAATNSDFVKQTQKVLSLLNKKEEKISRMRFGIGEKQAHTLEEVGQDFGHKGRISFKGCQSKQP
jgi:RNA polymerase primary sigma factor